MKHILTIVASIIAFTAAAEAKGGRQVFNAPYEYNYKREQKAGYIKDYCEDSVGNHVYCTGKPLSVQDGTFVSSYRPK